MIVSFKPEILLENVKYTVPERGDKLKLLEFAQRNAVYYKLEREKREIKAPENRTARNLEKLKNDLHMPGIPFKLNASIIQILWAKIRSQRVLFSEMQDREQEGLQAFNIKSVSGPDDFQLNGRNSIQEV